MRSVARLLPIVFASSCATQEASEPMTMDGVWTLDRALGSIDPIPPTTQPCAQAFTTGFQPSQMTIVGDVVATDSGMPVQHVVFGSKYDLEFDAQEYWNTVGWNDLVTLHYTFEQVAADELHGSIVARPPQGWPTGTCAYRYVIISRPSS